MTADDTRQVRGAKSESLFREVNEQVRRLSQENEVDILCECADDSCTALITLASEEYEAVRANPLHFPMKPGHEDLRIERVVEEHDDYVVVEKFDLAAEIARKLDPRSRGS